MTNYIATPLQSNTPWIPGATFVIGAYFELTAGLANGDTITWQNAITPSGITAIEVKTITTQLDSNAAPTGTFEFGDSNGDASALARYISGAKMGSNVAGQELITFSNVAPAFTAGVQSAGVGYNYFNDENSATNEANGFEDLILTVTNAPATAAATGTVWMYFTYYCVGNP